MSSAPAPCWAKAVKAASKSCSLPAFKVRICSPRARAATRASLSCDSAPAMVGLTSTPITPAFGTTSCRSSSCLDSKSALLKKETPVILPLVKVGLVAGLNRPGGNITGFSFFNSADLESKQLELLHEVVPKAGVIGVLVNPTMTAAESQERDARVAARALGLQILTLNAGSERDFDAAFAAFAQQGAGALLIAGNALFTGQRDRLVALAARYALPTIYGLREFVLAGGMMSYGGSLTVAYRQVGVYAARILKGEKSADLPVVLPTKYELVINLKTAKALGLQIPDKVLALADEVIE